MLNLFVLGLFAALMVCVVALVAMRPVLFKMGARNFVRHKTHSVLVVSGLLIGTAIISGAMVTGDSIDNFIVKGTYDSLDLIDVEVKAKVKGGYFNETIASDLVGDSVLDKYADAISPAIVERIAVVSDLASGQSESQMQIVGFDPSSDESFGSFSLASGGTTYGESLGGAEVLINQNAAGALNASAGDQLVLTYFPVGENQTITLVTVSDIVLDSGKGNYQMAPSIFARLDVVQDMFNVAGKVNLVKISGDGDMREGVEWTDEIMAAVNSTLAASADPDASLVAPEPVKEKGLEQSREIGEMVTTFITIFGSFSIIAGVILIINIFTMLAEERKSELGMARAVGMTRGDLMKMFLFEGSTYTLAASAIGTFAGLGIAYGLIYGVNESFTMFGDISIPFYFEWTSLLDSFFVGASITLLTIVAASWRVTNINIVRAIRDIEDPVHEKGSRSGAVLGGIIAALAISALAFAYDDLVTRYVAPCVALLGIGVAMRGFASAKASFSVSAVGIIAWTAYAIATFFDETGEGTEYLFVSSGVFLVLAAVLIVMFNSSLVVGAVTGTIGRVGSLRPVVKTAVSHPLNRRFRTGMTVSMFTLVIYTIVMVSVFTAIFSMNVDDQVEQQGGGYQIIGTTSAIHLGSLDSAMAMNFSQNSSWEPVWSDTLNNSIEKYEEISIVGPQSPAILSIDGSAYTGTGMWGMEDQSLGIRGIDDHFIENNEFSFTDFDSNYSSAREVWHAVGEANSSKIIYSGFGMGPAGGGSEGARGVGTVITIMTNGGPRDFTIVGTLDSMVLSGIFMHKDLAAQLFMTNTTFVMDMLFLFDVKDGYDIQEVTYALERDYISLGMNTINLRETVEGLLEMINSIFMLFQIFLGLGLVVGIAGLGIITIRSVVERRREIGVMRAIGFEKRKILASFVTEILFVTTLAVAIGVVVGIGVAYEIFTIMVEGIDVSFKIPWIQLAWLIGITYAASLACTIAPALKASRIPPAEALRTNE